MEKEIAYIKARVDVIYTALMGNPSKLNEPGLVIRIDRLEQSNKLKNKILCVLGIGVVTSFFRIIISLFK